MASVVESSKMAALVSLREGWRRVDCIKALSCVSVTVLITTLLLISYPVHNPVILSWSAAVDHAFNIQETIISLHDTHEEAGMWSLTTNGSGWAAERIPAKRRTGAFAAADMNCSPKQHIMFLKTHKCASSSVQNLFLRYGIKHNLSFALPETKNYLGSPQLFEASMIPENLLPAGGLVDIFTMHTRLNPSEHKKILHSDTMYITIVREPARLFDSLYTYFDLKYFYRITLKNFLNLPLQNQMSFPRKQDRFGRNMMLFDMGTDIHANMTATEIRRAVNQADKLFDLVLIVEKMDESLILLKELLCWDYIDIIFFTKHVRKETRKPSFSENTLEKMRELNSGDVLLYDHFLGRHEQAVLRFGESKMAGEVSTLRSLRDELFEDCVSRSLKGFNTDIQFKEYSDQVNSYVLRTNYSEWNCFLLSLGEMTFVNRIRRKQRQKKKL